MKKIIALVLATAMLATTMIGCNSSSSKSQAASTAAGSSATAGSGATDWPKKPINMVVPAKAGGGTDVQVRFISNAWNKSLSLPTTVSNYDTAAVGIQTAASAKPDGYNLLTTHSGFFCNYICGTLDVNPLKDLTTIACLHYMGTQCLVARPDAPYNTFKEMVEYSKSNKITAAVSTNGASQFMMDLVKQETGAKFSYKESGSETEKLTNLAGGFIDVGICTLDHAISYSKAGKLKVLGSYAADGKHTDASLGDNYKTFQDMGYPKIYWGSYMLVMGPKGMDEKLVEQINTSLKKVTEDNDYIKGVKKQGGEVQWLDVKASRAEVENEYNTIVSLAKANGSYVQG